MGRTRITLGLVLASTVVVVAGVGLFRVANRPNPPAENAPAEPPWDRDIEGYDVSAANEPTSVVPADAGPFLARHCTPCHAPDRATGRVSLVTHPSEATTTADRALWQRAAVAVRSGRMPPPGRPQPTPVELESFVRWAETAGVVPGPRHVTLRRLNRAEYNNSIRDLIGVAFRPADDFPADDTGDGFDTLGDVLSVSPTLIEKYLTAAETVVEAAATDEGLWQTIRTPPTEDFVPFILRGPPPERANAVKGSRIEADQRAVEIDRAYSALQAFADRAYRRPITHAEMARLMRFVDEGLNRGDGADAGLKLAMKAILVSPHFLFKIERGPESLGPGSNRPLTDYEFATRMSYFLWASVPDDELSRLAAAGTLRDARTLVSQVRRMLASPKSRALAEHFAGQWLQTRALADSAPDPTLFPNFDNDLRQAMRMETELFVDHIVREDRSILDLLTGEYTFVNSRLAAHYGLTGVTGDSFRQVSLAGTGRAGVLTHASVLTVTSGPTRTSPVKRGKWILENIFGSPVPPPPPGADNFNDHARAPSTTLRERLERHRSRAECASCHARMDPLGFVLENFDAVGAWRDRDGDAPLDVSGALPDGQSLRGPAGLLRFLASRPDEFTRCLSEKLMTYGLGRGLEPADRPAIDRVVRHAARNGYRFSSLVVALVRSGLFQNCNAHTGGDP